MLALKKAPKYSRHLVFRGVKENLSSMYTGAPASDGKPMKVTWRGFSSTTNNVSALSNDLFLGMTGVRTIFNIELTTGRVRDISMLSMIPGECEALLPPNTKFQVVGVLGPSADGLLTVQLEEVPPSDPILNF